MISTAETDVTSVSSSASSDEIGKSIEENGLLDTEPSPKAEEKEEEKTSFSLRVFRYGTTTDYILIVIGSILSLGSGVCLPMFMTLFGSMVDVFNPEVTPEHGFTFYIDWMLYMGLISFAACGIGAWCLEFAAERQLRALRSNFLKNVMGQEMGWFDTFDTGTLAAKLNQYCLDIREAIGLKLSQLLMFAGMFISGYVIGIVKGWQLALVLTAPMPLLALGGAFMFKAIADAGSMTTGAYAKAAAVAEEAFMSIRSVVAFGQEETISDTFDDKLLDAQKDGIKGGISKGLGLGMTLGVLFLTYSLGFWYGSELVAEDLRDYGDRCNTEEGLCWTAGSVLTVFFTVIIAAFSLGQAGPSLTALSKGSSAVVNISTLLDRKSLIDPYDEAGYRGDRNEFRGDIEFRNVGFSYPARPEKSIFRDISLRIEAGKSVALVGASGCGKSTIIQLIERYYDPTSGYVTLDGRNASEYNLRWLRENMAIVSQEPRLFAKSIAENISYGKIGSTREEVIEAGKKANAHNFISEFPDGYDTFVGESGSQLSGGQKQRIAIARAILRNPAILILDEATSALDNESERIVQQTLDELIAEKARTTIIIAHRLSTVRNADKIIVLDNRQNEGATVIEEGTHDQLMENPDGVYHSLVTSQQLNRPKTEGEVEDVIAEIAEKFTAEMPPRAQSLVSLRSKYSKQWSKISTDNSKTSKLSLTARLSKVPEEGGAEKKKVKMGRVLALVKDSWWKFVIGIIGAIINGCLFPVFGIIFSYFVETFLYEDWEKIEEKGNFWACMFIVMAVAAFLGQCLQMGTFEIIGQDIIYQLRSELFNQILYQDIAFFDDPRHSTGALSELLSSDVILIKGWAGDNMGILVQNVSCFICALIISFLASPALAGVSLAAFFMMAPVAFLQMKFMQTGQSSAKNEIESPGYIMNEAVTNMRTVAAYCLEDSISAQYRAIVDKDFKIGSTKAIVAGFLWGFSQFAQYAVQALCLWYGGKLVTDGDIGPQQMMQAIFALIMAAMGLGQTMIFSTDGAKAKEAASRVYTVIDRVPLIDARSKDGKVLNNMTGHVAFVKANFSYPMRPEVPIYRNLTFDVPPGKTVALVGASGCGKSTTVQLLERFYDLRSSVDVTVEGPEGKTVRQVKGGSILVDGIDIRDINVASLRSRIGLVSQEPLLFSASIASNIRLGKPDATMEEIEEAAKKANAHSFIEKFPRGYETEVGKFGGQLSGGQKQRIALARAILRDPRILVLDEATSALDAESEKIVQKALDDLLEKSTRTTIIIAHRLSTIRNADKIVVFVNEDRQGSMIAESGTHDELMRIPNGTYRGLVLLTEGKH